MKLLQRTIVFMSGALLITLTVWALIFYFNMIDEVHDSIDDGLDNSKLLIIHEAEKDSTVLEQVNFDEGNYSIHRSDKNAALVHVDSYADTLMYMENEDDLEPVRLLTTVFEANDGHFYQLKVISSMVEEDDLIEDLFYSLLWLYIILIVTILAVNYLVLRSIWKPFYTFLEKLGRFKLGKNEQVEMVPSKIPEFRELNEVVLKVLEQNIRSFNQQKQLIENTSHELQTPLAIVLNKLQLIAENEKLDEATVREVFKAIETLQRLSQLNKSLQMLSKIENRQFMETDRVDLVEETRKVLGEFSDQFGFKELEVNLVVNDELFVQMHKDLASILLVNVVKNAVRHNYKGGKIEIVIEEKLFRIKNTGKDSPLNTEKLFTRFYKEGTDSSSTGLGLAIVHAIAELSDIEVHYHFDGMHQFELKFQT